MEQQRVHSQTIDAKHITEHRPEPLPYYWTIIFRHFYNHKDKSKFLDKLANEGLDFGWRPCYNVNTVRINVHLCSSTKRSIMMIMQLKYAEDINKHQVLIIPYQPNTKEARISFQRDRTDNDS